VARAFHETHVEPHRTDKHGQQWINSIEQHLPANLLDRPIEDIQAKELLDTLLALRTRVRETGRRIAQRLGLVFAHAKLTGIIPVNPLADIKPLLRETKRDKKVQSHAALPFAEVPGFVRQLRGSGGIAPFALEFTLRTAARTGETLGMTWTEVDLDAGVWTIPGPRMKGGEMHVVFLPARAVEILREAKKLGSAFCFPSPQNNAKPLSTMAMANVLRRLKVDDRATVHGMRASFSTWAYESCQRQRPDLAREDVIECCLAHGEGNKVKAAYSRSKFDDDRRELLALWSTFVDSKPAPVVDIVPGAQRNAA
jgi:integrase